jgi:hypothetical protein
MADKGLQPTFENFWAAPQRAPEDDPNPELLVGFTIIRQAEPESVMIPNAGNIDAPGEETRNSEASADTADSNYTDKQLDIRVIDEKQWISTY